MKRVLVSAALALLASSSWAQNRDSGSEPVLIPSSACLSCHGGATPYAGHPVGVDFAASRSRTLRPITSLTEFGATIANDFLVDGRVECTSCHFTHAQETSTPARLRLPKTAEPIIPEENLVTTSLCVSCHDLSRF